MTSAQHKQVQYKAQLVIISEAQKIGARMRQTAQDKRASEANSSCNNIFQTKSKMRSAQYEQLVILLTAGKKKDKKRWPSQKSYKSKQHRQYKIQNEKQNDTS